MNTLEIYKYSRNNLLDSEIENEILKYSTKILNKELVIQSTEEVLKKKFLLIGAIESIEIKKQKALERKIRGSLNKWKFLSLLDKYIVNAKIHESRDYRYLKIDLKINNLFNDIIVLQYKIKTLLK